jgi:GTP-binding protein EngB required for normal cell division
MPSQHSTGVPANSDTAAALALIGRVATDHHLGELQRRCETAVTQGTSRLMDVAVLGRFKAGKTTLLNGLLHENLLPVQAIPATAVITRVRYGPATTAHVRLVDGQSLDIDPQSLADWVTESGNPDNVRGVDWVEITSPGLRNLASLLLVDTPGTGSSWEHNTETSLGWLPNVGAAIVAINCTQPVGDDDIHLIEALTPHTPNVTIVLTKADLLTEEDLAEVLEHVHHRLSTTAGAHAPVLPYSTAARHRPYRDRLREHLKHLDDTHLEAIDELTGYRVARLAADCETYLTLALNAATSNREAIAQLRAALEAERLRLPSLRQQATAQLRLVKNTIEEASKRNLAGAVPKAIARLQIDLPRHLAKERGSLAAETRQYRGWLKRSVAAEFTPVAHKNAELLTPLIQEGLEPIRRMGEAFTNRLSDLLNAATGAALALPTPELVPGQSLEVDVHVDTIFDSHLEMLSWAIPMPLFRGVFHRHFQQIVPWQVEKNSFRLAYQAAGAANKSLDLTLASYMHALQEQLETCQQLVSSDAGALKTITSDLAQLAEAAGRVTKHDRPTGAGADDGPPDSPTSLARSA